ncbi:MAG: hypothetical protein R3220_13210 [Balneolaceae bacterium]|nr:hypothetical protein [Balneolaceae bacterium]
MKGKDVYASLWYPAVYDCDEILAADPIATGTANVTYTDNDLFAAWYPNENANVYGFSSSGKLETAMGKKINVNAHSRCVWDGEDFATLKCKEKVNVSRY